MVPGNAAAGEFGHCRDEALGVVVRLVDDERLERLSVVANSAMKRDRGVGGRDGYVRNVGIDPLAVLGDRLADLSGPVRWLDLCCGSGAALLQAAQRLPDRVEIIGLDLVDFFAGPPVDGVGDKLGVLTAAAAWLTGDGVLVANFDAGGVRLPDGRPVGRRLIAAVRGAGFAVDGRRRRVWRDGCARVRLPFRSTRPSRLSPARFGAAMCAGSRCESGTVLATVTGE